MRWDTLGTYGYLATGDPARLDDAHTIAREVLAAVDRTCSRFRDDSDLEHANRQPGRWVTVDPLLVAAVDVAVAAARATDGLVDPCLGRSLVLLGYDADLAVVQSRGPVPGHRVTPTPDAWQQIGTDPEGGLLVPEGCAIDLGATCKAWASDLVAASIVDRLGCDLVVSLGGDVRIAGPRAAGLGDRHHGAPRRRRPGAGLVDRRRTGDLQHDRTPLGVRARGRAPRAGPAHRTAH